MLARHLTWQESDDARIRLNEGKTRGYKLHHGRYDQSEGEQGRRKARGGIECAQINRNSATDDDTLVCKNQTNRTETSNYKQQTKMLNTAGHKLEENGSLGFFTFP